MTQEYKDLLYIVENGVAWVRFNRPQVLNAFTQNLYIELHRAIRRVKNDPDVRVMVITGEGRGFAAGRDMNEQAESLTGELRSVETDESKPSGSTWEIGLEMWNMQKPIIAAVNGVAVGGGLSIVLESDIILASENATFGEFFVRRGVVSSGLGQWLLPRLVGMHRAKEMLMLGELIDAEQAKEWGLVNHVYPVDEFQDRVKEFAEKLAQGPAQAIGMMKRLVNDGMSMSIEATGRAEIQADRVLMVRHRDQINEGITSYMEKRAPRFEGAISERQWSEEKYK
jgi:2-(1,2-epoxy-1,2-dihydrophenyl)acetyl-CoA isomerase